MPKPRGDQLRANEIRPHPPIANRGSPDQVGWTHAQNSRAIQVNPSSSFEIIESDAALVDVAAAIGASDCYAIDTEFHRERTYYPQLALVQAAWDDELVLIDPLACDLTPLGSALESGGTAVIHAASQDLEVLDLATGRGPSRLFDTQIAAAFLGMRTPSLAALHDHYLGLKLPKGSRLTDWMRRPLEADQLRYAASDVERLVEIKQHQCDELEQAGRDGWAGDEFELVRVRGTATRDPEDAWLRIKEARSLGATARTIAQAIAAWRERSAQRRDIPVRHVLPDLAVVALAQRPPKSADRLNKTRGLERRSVSKRDADELMEVIAWAQSGSRPAPMAPRRPKRGPDLRPAVTLIAAWITQFADDYELDPAMLGSRSDIEEFVRGGESRLSSGWRHNLVGSAIKSLLDGEASVAFGGDGRVVVEERSHQPIQIAANPES